MNCPKCEAAMEKVAYGSIEVDRCTQCEGIWFDMLEAEHLKDMAGSEAIDIGDPALAKKFNEMEHVKCPVCQAEMIGMVDAQQPHIWYEGCPVCYGLFFDAGEFKDFKEETVLDFVRDMFAKER